MLRIGDLGKITSLEPKTLRYYDRVGLVPPSARSPTGYRLYAPDTVRLVQFILRAKALGVSLADIRRVLAFRAKRAPACHHVLELVTRELAELQARRAQLDALRRDLGKIQRELNASLSTGGRPPRVRARKSSLPSENAGGSIQTSVHLPSVKFKLK